MDQKKKEEKANQKKEETQNQTKTSIKILVATLAFSLILIAQSIVSSSPMLQNGPVNPMVNILGVLTIAQLMAAVFIVVVTPKGYHYMIIYFCLEICILVFRIVMFHAYTAIPGVAMMIGGICIVSIIHRYIDRIQKNEMQMFALAHTDVLTNLPNRRAFKKQMELLQEEKNARFAIVMVDLDNFKKINDTIGHDWGDRVLEGMAERWKKCMSEDDFLARLGGDEFAIIISRYHTLKELNERLHAFMDVADEKFVLKGMDYYVSASMGIAIYPSDHTETSQLLKYADMAMYVAKSQGKKRMCFFDGLMTNALENNVKLEGIIRHALECDAFSLVYQPQFRTKDKNLRGFETLIRMSDNKGKPVSPVEFIPVAERTTLIRDIDCWVLAHAMTDFVPLVQKNHELLLSVNISAAHMLDDVFLNDMDEILLKTGFPPENLELELTESVFVDSLERAKKVMNEVKKRGIQIALDDFGTGYSSLSYLKELPIDLLKIDKSFVDMIREDEKDETFIAAIISLSQIMKFAVISEGVEEDYQLKLLEELGCNYIQGYLWGKPLLLDNVRRLLDTECNSAE